MYVFGFQAVGVQVAGRLNLAGARVGEAAAKLSEKAKVGYFSVSMPKDSGIVCLHSGAVVAPDSSRGGRMGVGGGLHIHHQYNINLPTYIIWKKYLTSICLPAYLHTCPPMNSSPPHVKYARQSDHRR